MSDAELLTRICAFVIIGFSLAFSRVYIGKGISNLPFWTGIGVTFLYACYGLFGIRFSNGFSAGAELTLALLIAVNSTFFLAGSRFAGPTRKKPPVTSFKRPVPARYMWALGLATLGFYVLLTQGQPWRLVTDAVGLKFERLYGIAEKSAVLLNVDALVLAMTMVAFAWSILAYQDDKRSRRQLLVTTALLLLYVQSTGSRTPLLAVGLQFLPALAEARLRSKHMAWIARKKWLFFNALVGGLLFMIITTGSRIEFEALDQDVFRRYFHIDDFGAINGLLEMGDAASFFLSTMIVYAASTFNNIIIRFQELGAITPSMGYKFVFFYVAAMQIALPDLLPETLASWRDLATTNNDHLLSVSVAATQWATPYGDLLWDFGVIGAVMTTALFSFASGFIMGRARRRPTFENVLLKVVVLGFSLSPLVNPLLSLYVHYALFIVLFLVIRQRKARRRRFIPPSAAPTSVSLA